MQLRALNSRIVDLNMEVAKLGGTAPGVIDAKAKIAASKTATAQVPQMTESAMTLNYATPIESSLPTSTTASTFPQILGTKSTPTTLIGLAYLSLTTY